MAAGAFIIPNKCKLSVVPALAVATPANWRLALVGSGWTPDNTDTGNELWADVSANEIANGNGYITGGLALTSVALSLASGTVKFTSAAGSWTASGSGIPAWRRMVLYYLGTLNGKVNPLLAHALGDSTGVDVPLTTSGNPLNFTPNAAGILNLA